MPQSPQWVGSVARSKQPPPPLALPRQQVSLPTQLGPPAQAQAPSVQLSPLWQTRSQAPQSKTPGLTQWPAQQSWLSAQAASPQRHWPPVHSSPAAQVWPQAPQFFGSFCVLAQPESQQVSPVPQATPLQAQPPPAQCCGAAQAVPQVPQLASSVPVFTHAPLQQTSVTAQVVPPQAQPVAEQLPSPQQASPAAQAAPLVPQAHWPATHCSPGLQAWSQAPQWNGSFCKSKQPSPLQQLMPGRQAEPPARRLAAPEQLSPPGEEEVPQGPQL
jgi:hypothetical protein